MSESLISIVLPVYNGEAYLKESIGSCIAQTYHNWELIIVDDCSTDSTPEIAKEFAKKDSRVHYFRNEVNSKLPQTLNNGFARSKGNYLTWTSDDNLFKPEALEKMLNALKSNTDCQFVFAAYEIIDENGTYIDHYYAPPYYKKLIVGTDVVGACFMYSRAVYEAVGDYDVNMFLCEDYDYWLRVFARFGTCYVREILYAYRRHGGSLTGTERAGRIEKVKENVLLKNIGSFGKLDFEQKAYFYHSLDKARSYETDEKLKKEYRLKKNIYNTMLFICKTAPRRIVGRIKR